MRVSTIASVWPGAVGVAWTSAPRYRWPRRDRRLRSPRPPVPAPGGVERKEPAREIERREAVVVDAAAGAVSASSRPPRYRLRVSPLRRPGRRSPAR